ncbi:hypothetical protein PSTG_19097, partial [Puccinia striiformis f. sp. tritici PST-78]
MDNVEVFYSKGTESRGGRSWGHLEATVRTMGAKGARLPRAPSSAPSQTLRRNLQWFRTPVGQSPVKRGKPPVPVASVHTEAPDNLLEALHGASVDEEHRTVMSAVIEK